MEPSITQDSILPEGVQLLELTIVLRIVIWRDVRQGDRADAGKLVVESGSLVVDPGEPDVLKPVGHLST